MSLFTILMGLPGSGKSTFLNQDQTDSVILSTDNYIEEYAKQHFSTYSQVFKEAIVLGEKQLNIDLDNAIKDNKSCYLDQTNLSVKKRARILSKVPDSYYKSIYFFDVSLEIIKDRVEKRGVETGKLIPLQVLEDMYTRLEVPTYNENVDRIVIFDEFGNIKQKLIK